MRALNIKILILTAAVCSSTVVHSSSTSADGKIFRKHSYSASDTSELNRHIRNAMNFDSKSKGLNFLKAHIDTAESICVEKNIEFPSSLNLLRAEYFLLTSDFRSASQEATIAMKKSRSNGEMEILAKTMKFFGSYSMRTGFYMESISYLENCIDIAKKNKIKGLIPKSYYGLYNVYNKLGNLRESRVSLYKLIDAAALENDTLSQLLGYWAVGTSFCRDSVTDNERDFKLADSLLRKCLEISIIKKDTLFIARSLQNIGWNYYIERNYDLAIKFYNKSLTYSIPAKFFGNSANSLGNLGTIYRDLGQTENSKKYYQSSIEQAEMVNDISSLWWVYRDMSAMFLLKGDTSSAYKSYVMFKKYNDILLQHETSQGLTDARIRYEADSHNKEVELLNLRVYNQRLLIYGAIGLFALSVAVLALLLSRAKINAKRRISEMNRKISEITQANLRQQMNPHFIFNTLNSIQYYMYQHDKLATNNYLTKFSSLMRKVLENSQHTSVPLRDELDALNLYLDLEMIRFKDKFEYQINIDEEIDTLLYKVPTMLIQPYVENSICHGLMPGEGKGSLRIDLKLENEYILCTIEDNGIGREAAYERRNKSDNNHNSLGTQIVSSRLDLVNALYGTSLKTIYTDLMNENGEPAGTRVEIQIPILS
jgi:tetratricopeptide (TPR) repeat protein